MSILEGSSVLVTGGTGSFGRRFVERAITDGARRVVVFSRDELKQHEMQSDPVFATRQGVLRFFLGDVRDRDRLLQAFHGVDFVVHAAALKQVPACEYNPFEAVRTNVLGAQNVIDAALARNVRRVVALSTDKACNPINLYGATKLCSDKLFVAGNAYSGPQGTRFAVVRYGNVIGSRGSVIPFFLERRASGSLPITHPEMTRFWITLEQGVDFVLRALGDMLGGEIFVPKIPSMRLTDLAEAIAPGCQHQIVGIRPGEKLHEVMISSDDALNVIDQGDRYVLEPTYTWRDQERPSGRPVAAGFSYASNTNDKWLTVAELRALIDGHIAGRRAGA